MTRVLGASNLSMHRYEWVWYKSRCTGFLNARRAPLKRTENILVFYQKLPYYDPQFEQGKPYKKISREGRTATTMENSCVPAVDRRTACAFTETF
jgi:site-specific DNA-methyltransferase (adenine-specific)